MEKNLGMSSDEYVADIDEYKYGACVLPDSFGEGSEESYEDSPEDEKLTILTVKDWLYYIKRQPEDENYEPNTSDDGYGYESSL